jgi:hypothetical protein
MVGSRIELFAVWTMSLLRRHPITHNHCQYVKVDVLLCPNFGNTIMYCRGNRNAGHGAAGGYIIQQHHGRKRRLILSLF